MKTRIGFIFTLSLFCQNTRWGKAAIPCFFNDVFSKPIGPYYRQVQATELLRTMFLEKQ